MKKALTSREKPICRLLAQMRNPEDTALWMKGEFMPVRYSAKNLAL